MDREQVKQWREGWAAAAAVEQEEDRRATVAERWRRFQAIMQMARALGWIGSVSEEREREVAVARAQWVKLRAAWPGNGRSL
jgi:hypothetical protein